MVLVLTQSVFATEVDLNIAEAVVRNCITSLGERYTIRETKPAELSGQKVGHLIHLSPQGDIPVAGYTIRVPITGLASQNRCINKVDVCNDTSQMIFTCPDVNDLSVFVHFISTVTDNSSTVVAAKAAVDEFRRVKHFATFKPLSGRHAAVILFNDF